MFSLFCLVFLLMISVNCSQRWEVQYTDMMKCALKGSTVHLSGSYKHPNNIKVKDEFWIVNPVKGAEPVNLLNHPDYTGRVQFFRTDGLFFLNLSDVKHEDKGIYCIRILTDVDKDKYLFYRGIELKVTDLRVEIPEEVVEGQSPVLVCKSTCNLSDKADFTWYKDGEELSEGMNLNHLSLRSVNSEDTGNYSCAARDQKHLPSAALTLSVRYPPRSVRVSVSPSAEVVEGDSVTLICSSDSNPPALNFSWFKENQSSAVGSEQSLIISSFNSRLSGLYYCEAQNQHGSRRSASVSLTSAGVQKTALYAAAGVGAGIVCICIITVVIKIISRKTGDVQRDVSKQENNSTAETDEKSVKPSETADPKDVVYSSVAHSRARKPPRAGDEDEVQYASVQLHRNTTTETGRQNRNTPSAGLNSEAVDDSSVIYSSVNVA
ncbi:myelin-associated glycoprotein-like isoform X2 [Puntigrus tetrazona]|uniref:myelin-associated glycoprotein-like isoform X2 n=1 Tax=Puntigrus tetrazona TaxID=1606681 RepID=UPI001C8A7878|nr:myelin-associated glycoprotein-like isoform X2 [Puntigrus tetrazona]